MSYRDDVAALSARHEALSEEVAAKRRELDETRRLLDDAKRARTPALPYLRVATPCSADWNAMTGDERVRLCAQCDQNVYFLSNMTRDEAEALIFEKNGKLCLRYYERHDGTIILKDCEVGLAKKRKRRVIAAGAVALLAGGGGAAYRLTQAEPERLKPVEVMLPELVVTPPRPAPEPHEVRVTQGVPPPPETPPACAHGKKKIKRARR